MSWVARGSLLVPGAPKDKEPQVDDLRGGVTITTEAIRSKSLKELRKILHVELMDLEGEMMEEIKRLKKGAKRA